MSKYFNTDIWRHILTCWHILLHMLTYWHIQTYADLYWHIVTYTNICCHMLTYILTYADILTYTDVCWHMLTYTDISSLKKILVLFLSKLVAVCGWWRLSVLACKYNFYFSLISRPTFWLNAFGTLDWITVSTMFCGNL